MCHIVPADPLRIRGSLFTAYCAQRKVFPLGRLDKLPPYLFSAIDAAKRAALDKGVDVVDLGIGDPDRPTPASLVEIMAAAVADPAFHRYPAQRGTPRLRQAIAAWLKKRHQTIVDPDSQVLVLIGSKEGLGHLPTTCVEEGDNVLVPDLGYPVYGQATLLAGGQPRVFSLSAQRGFLPDFDELEKLADEKTRLIFLNYPNNPTGAVAGMEFWKRMISFCGQRNIRLVNDAAYLEVVPGGEAALSLLQVADPSRDQVIELHSLSKMFNMTGWRIAFAVGHPQLVGDLGRVKESMDSGVFNAVQETATYALGEAFEGLLPEVMGVYPERRRVINNALAKMGVEVFPSPATFYVWAKVPTNESSIEFCGRALEEIGTVITPGLGFGIGGEGWFRISLTASDEAISEGARRLEGWK
jgi:LL-diaminopimelate aminotransferase